MSFRDLVQKGAHKGREFVEKKMAERNQGQSNYQGQQQQQQGIHAPYPSAPPIPPTSSRPPPSYPAPTPLHPPPQPVTPRLPFPLPELHLQIRDLEHEGAKAFLRNLNAGDALREAVYAALSILYESPACPTTTAPQKAKITLILRSMDGVAYTTGGDCPNSSEIHFSLEHIRNTASERQGHEIRGVLLHEMVHCVQYNGIGTCNGGLIEGIADWVRLQANLGPPHWRRAKSDRWDCGYDRTGYFLQYLEDRFGQGTIRRLNEKLRIEKYDDKRFWTELVGAPVEQLWGDYCALLDKEQHC